VDTFGGETPPELAGEDACEDACATVSSARRSRFDVKSVLDHEVILIQ
jgi:hypothetical protein